MSDFPDYEAADVVGGGVLWPYEPEMRIKIVRKIVDAALGDKTLYRISPCTGTHCTTAGHGQWVRVWPKEEAMRR